MRLLFATLLTLIAFRSFANTFIVTSNADAGTGSLRDAITQAAASGPGPNLITFNIADPSRAGRTITLVSALPQLPGNLTIDGTTQPGTAFGISAAKIIITDRSAGPNFYYFNLTSVNNIQIYGLFLQSSSNYQGIYIQQCNNVSLGAAGKGNILQGFQYALMITNLTNTTATTSNIVIQGNIFGTDENGTSASPAELNGMDINTADVTNLQIGGLNPGEGNQMNQTDLPLLYTLTDNGNFGYVNIQGNKEGTDITGNVRLSPTNKPFLLTGNVITAQTFATINITNNVSVGGYEIAYTYSPFTIQGNYIGVGQDGVTDMISGYTNANGMNVSLNRCGPGLVGGSGPGQKNYIANNVYGLGEEDCPPVTLSQNSFFCNTTGILLYQQDYPHPFPYVNITLLSGTSVGGTALPNSIIELFYDDLCPGCEGKTYIGKTVADASGNWSYTLASPGAIVATATDTYGQTSGFSTATINTNNVVVTNATCGRNNGSIKNLQVASGTDWYWQDASGNKIANTTDITGLAPGTYTFVASIGGQSCTASSTPYTISSVNLPAFDPTKVVPTQPSCGQNTGGLTYTGLFDQATTYSWSLAGNIICPDYSAANPLNQLAPGDYTLQLALKEDPTCTAQYGPFVLVNQAGPSLVTTNASVVGTTCGNANGSVTGITYQNATAPVYYAWRNDLGATIATTLDLIHATAGTYHFVFKDGGGCDTIFSSPYTITDQGSITYDTSAMVILPASCGKNNGAINNITVTNVDVFHWTNLPATATGNNDVSLFDIPGGAYQLTMNNSLGCQVQTPFFTVPQIPVPAFDYTALQVLNDTCNAGIGAIRDLGLADASRSYTWSWSTAVNNTPVATTAGYFDSLNAGDYIATVTDQYACKATSKIFAVADIELAPPTPQVSDQYIPRNTATTITVGNPQRGEYYLLDGPSMVATILDSSALGSLQTPVIPQDETLYIGFARADCSSPIVPVNIKVFDSARVFVPNAFTPNGPANKHWHIVIQGLTKKFQVSVFDRWGNMVFTSNDPNMSWDGTAGGHALSGTFVYMLSGVDYYNKPFELKGTLMIIR